MTFHLMCVYDISSSVSVAEWPPFGNSPVQISRTIAPSDYWALGLSGPRAIEPSDYRAPGLSDPRNMDPEYRTLGLPGVTRFI